MDELLRLLGLTEDLTALDDDALAALVTDLRAECATLLAAGPSDDQLEPLERVAVALEAIGVLQGEREAAAAERQERIDALAARIIAPEDEDEVDPEALPEGEPDPASEAAVIDDAPEPPAEPVTEAEPAAVAAAATEVVPGITVAAALVPAPLRTAAPLSRRPTGGARSSARRPASMSPAARPVSAPAMALVAAANLPHIPAGAVIDSPVALAEAMMSGYEASAGYRGPRAKVPIARIGRQRPADLFGEDRTLYIDDAQANTRKLEALTDLPVLQASGGICAIPNVDYDLPVVGSDARPVRDTAMNRVGAERGGIRTLPVPDFDELTDAITVWSIENDESPGSDGPATKPCLAMTCLDFDEDLVDAIVLCLTIGNFRARFNPESVTNFIARAAIAQAREAETRLLTAIGAGSKQVNSGQLLGATSDVLTTLDRLLEGIRSRRRILRTFPFRLVLPAWLLGLLRANEARRGSGGTTDESYAVADSKIEQWIRTRGVNITWHLDGETGQIFGPQGDGPVLGWPSTVVAYLYPEGGWNFLDGGMLDIGIIRDTTNTAVNNYTIFSETWEGSHYHGIDESYRLTMDVCADGALANGSDIDPCSIGS